MNNFVLLGGYAVKEIIDIQTNKKEYVNLNHGSLWMEISYKMKDFALGLFAGYSRGFGANSYINQITEIYGAGTTIKNMYNLSPRFIYAPGKLKLALELNNTAASFGNYDNYLNIINDKKQVNYRYLLSVSFNF